MEKNKKFNLLRKKYETFIFENYEFKEDNENINIKYFFSIPNLTQFKPEIKISKKTFKFNNINTITANSIIFHIGLVELISYWKCTCSPNVIIKCGNLNDEQVNWFKKLYFYGLGELFYINNIQTSFETFMNIECDFKKPEIKYDNNYSNNFSGTIIPIGGGKDSVVTLELLKNTDKNYCFIVNPKTDSLECAKIAGYSNNQIIEVNRSIDKELIRLNGEGFINGHTPFSALLAFLSYFTAFITNKKYIALSNESSANESNITGEKVNHQYSKSYEFEQDFNFYTRKYLNSSVQYFSFLRPINELQIAMLFSRFEKYHSIFKSCNVGSKNKPWNWCSNCPKCLFVFIILSPFLYKEKLINIFGTDMFEKEELLTTFKELIGQGETKPFECVGTFEEITWATTYTIKNLCEINLPYLLRFYKENYSLANLNNDITKLYNEENNLPKEFDEILRKEIIYD